MNRWWCRLDNKTSDTPTALHPHATQLGIQAWVLDAEVEHDGTPQPAHPCEPLLEAAAAGEPALTLWLNIQKPLSPLAEERLAAALAPWLGEPGWLRFGDRPVLVLGGLAGLSHPHFGLQRLRLSLRRQLRQRGDAVEPWLLATAHAEGCDAELLWPSNGVENYRVHLQQAHHGPWPAQGWIPVVRAPQPGEAGGHPELYGEWLAQAGALSRCCWDGHPQAPVLLESAEAHQQWWMEPPAATTPLATPTELIERELTALAWGTPNPQHLALMVHGYYPDQLELLLTRLGEGATDGIDLYVSTRPSQLQTVAEGLQAQGWPRVRLFPVENRGRDVAPFLLQLLPCAMANGHELFVKVHTKRSSHLADGDAWADHLLSSLLEPTALQRCLAALRTQPQLGLLAPAGTLMACSVALHTNVEHLLSLSNRRGINPSRLLQLRFIAGSMMAGRLEALRSVQALGLTLSAFELEQGQTDGTLAHALERWICCEAAAQGWELQEQPGEAWAVPAFGHGRPPKHRAGGQL